MVPLPAAPQLLSPSNCSSFHGEQKVTPVHPGRPAQPAMRETCSQDLLDPGGCTAREKVLHTHRSVLGLLGAEEGLFFSQDTGAGGKEHPAQCPHPGAVPVSCPSLAQLPAGLDSHLLNSPAVCISTEHQPLTEGSLCPGYTQPSCQERDGDRPQVLVTTEHPKAAQLHPSCS